MFAMLNCRLYVLLAQVLEMNHKKVIFELCKKQKVKSTKGLTSYLGNKTEFYVSSKGPSLIAENVEF